MSERMACLQRRARGAGRLRFLIAPALAVVAAGCSGSTPTSPTRPQPTPTPALAISCPSDVTAAATSAAGIAVSFPAPTTSGGIEPRQATCTRQSGSLFAVGATAVQCTATDGAQRSASCTFTVTVSPPVPRIARTKFLAFGDSLTAGEVTVPIPMPSREDATLPNFRLVVVPSASYPTQLQNRFRARYTAQATDIAVTNAGLGGEWAQDAYPRLVAALSSVRPEVLILLHGHNEIGTQAQILPTAQAIDRMAKEARYRGVRVVLATTPPPRPGGSRALPLSHVQTFNAWIRDIARGEGALLVDLYAGLLGDVNRYLGLDGLHPTEAGYQRMADLFFDAIRAQMEIAPPQQ